jgi:hypothetical protein
MKINKIIFPKMKITYKSRMKIIKNYYLNLRHYIIINLIKIYKIKIKKIIKSY